VQYSRNRRTIYLLLLFDPDISLSTGTEIYGPHTFVVNVNGTIIGLTRCPVRFVTKFRRLRRARRFSEFVSVYINHHHRAVHVACDGGRICRPLIIVENGRSKVTTEHITVLRFPCRPFANRINQVVLSTLKRVISRSTTFSVKGLWNTSTLTRKTMLM